MQNMECNAYCPISYGIDTSNFVDVQVQDDFDSRNYGQLATGKRLDPGSLTRYTCPGGEALVKCQNNGMPTVEGVFAMPCSLPIRLCGCCATVGNIPVASARDKYSFDFLTLLSCTILFAAVSSFSSSVLFSAGSGPAGRR